MGLLQTGIPAWATISLVFLLGASVSVPYYVPLPAFNIRRGGSFSAVLEGGATCLHGPGAGLSDGIPCIHI